MQAAVDAGEFLEHAKVHGKMYGTSKAAVARVSEQGRVCILDIDIQGVQQCIAVDRHAVDASLAANEPIGSPLTKHGGVDAAAYIFVAPPSMSELEDRLRGRGTETEEKIQLRLRNALEEMTEANHVGWAAWVINDDVDKAYSALRGALVPVMEECDECNQLPRRGRR